MATCSDAPIHAFLSYSHYDKDFVHAVRGQEPELIRRLKNLAADGVYLEFDRDLKPGDSITPEVRHKLEMSQILIALVSEDFLNSKFCQDEEIGSMLARRRSGQNVVIIPLYLRPANWQAIPWLKGTVFIPSPDRTLSELGRAERGRTLLELANAVKFHANRIRGVK